VGGQRPLRRRGREVVQRPHACANLQALGWEDLAGFYGKQYIKCAPRRTQWALSSNADVLGMLQCIVQCFVQCEGPSATRALVCAVCCARHEPSMSTADFTCALDWRRRIVYHRQQRRQHGRQRRACRGTLECRCHDESMSVTLWLPRPSEMLMHFGTNFLAGHHQQGGCARESALDRSSSCCQKHAARSHLKPSDQPGQLAGCQKALKHIRRPCKRDQHSVTDLSGRMGTVHTGNAGRVEDNSRPPATGRQQYMYTSCLEEILLFGCQSVNEWVRH
jgi:hypothetical protein